PPPNKAQSFNNTLVRHDWRRRFATLRPAADLVENVCAWEKEIVYVLLPVHNRRDTTERFLKCLAKQGYPHIHLILLDDGSTDDTSGMAKEYFPKLTLLMGKGHWWWAGSLQQGHKWLQKNARDASDIALIINDDTTF